MRHERGKGCIMSEIAKLNPQCVWEWFDRICEIPRPTYHEEKIGQFLVSEAKKKGIEVEMDEKGNVRMDVPGKGGLENSPKLAIQAHMDMVPQKTDDSDHDFLKDPIRPRIVDGWVKATGTTLGADDGMGLSMGLALVFDETGIPHPPLRLIVTTEEEDGMGGAAKLKPEWLDIPYLVNLDTELDGCVYLGCAGGRYTQTKIKLNEIVPSGEYWKITLKGLKGGHSGVEIHLGLGNANKILARILSEIYDKFRFSLVDFKGGTAKNAIPRSAEAVIAIDVPEADWRKVADKSIATIKDELKAVDPGMEVVFEKTKGKKGFCPGCTRRVINHALAHPNGVQRMSDEFPGVVETSLSTGVFHVEENYFIIDAFVRSLMESPKDEVANRVRALAELTSDCEFSQSEDYPGWNPNPRSKLLKLFQEAYKKVAGDEPKIEIIHAGLECGIVVSKAPNLDVISFGPTIVGAHSPDERVNIESVGKNWKVLLELVASIK